PATLEKSLQLAMLGQTVLASKIIDLLTRADSSKRLAREASQHRADTLDNDRSYPLSERETKILDCLIRGDTNKLISRNLEIAEATVKVHVKAILRKIRAKKRTQAAVWARQYLPATPGEPALKEESASAHQPTLPEISSRRSGWKGLGF